MSSHETNCTAANIRPRPTSNVVVTLASGENAGQAFGIDRSTFEIGFDAACDVPLVSENDLQASPARPRLCIERSTSGWSIRDIGGVGFILNQSFVRASCELRSGDIIRMSWRGPDLQFALQSSDKPLTDLVASYLPATVSDVSSAEPTSVIEHAAPSMEPKPLAATNDQPYSARDTRIVSTSSLASRASPTGSSPSNEPLRKTMQVSREALAAAHSFQDNQRSRRPVAILVGVAVISVLLLLLIVYWFVGAQ